MLLFPFYWMTITALKPNDELTNFRDFNPLWPANPTLQHIRYLLFETSYPGWLLNTMLVAVGSTILSLVASVFAAYAIERVRFSRLALDRPRDLPRLSRAALDPVHPARRDDLQVRHLRHASSR